MANTYFWKRLCRAEALCIGTGLITAIWSSYQWAYQEVQLSAELLISRMDLADEFGEEVVINPDILDEIVKVTPHAFMHMWGEALQVCIIPVGLAALAVALITLFLSHHRSRDEDRVTHALAALIGMMSTDSDEDTEDDEFDEDDAPEDPDEQDDDDEDDEDDEDDG